MNGRTSVFPGLIHTRPGHQPVGELHVFLEKHLIGIYDRIARDDY